MKRLLLGGVALAALVSPALAIEIAPGVEAMPPAAEAAPYNWSGLYGRLNAPSPYDSSTFSATTPDSFLGGPQFGYNYQMGTLVLGVESDARRRSSDLFFGTNGADSYNFSKEQGWIGTLRPRAGLAADNWLFYGTGGLAYNAVSTPTTVAAVGTTRTGWTVGGGIEYAGGKQWSLGLEYLYADYGKSTPIQLAPSSTSFSALQGDDRSQVVRGKLNYRFGWGSGN
jgi:outer membrane immunogenic protein